jgi:hypothetical protein
MMLARAQKISVFLVLSVIGCALAGCKTDNTGTATPASSSTQPSGHVALLSPPTAGSGLVGWEANKILALYGKPAFVRKEAGSELWRYDGQRCAAFFFLYQDQAGLRVRHVETSPQQGAMGDAACLAGIKARAGASS